MLFQESFPSMELRKPLLFYPSISIRNSATKIPDQSGILEDIVTPTQHAEKVERKMECVLQKQISDSQNRKYGFFI